MAVRKITLSPWSRLPGCRRAESWAPWWPAALARRVASSSCALVVAHPHLVFTCSVLRSQVASSWGSSKVQWRTWGAPPECSPRGLCFAPESLSLLPGPLVRGVRWSHKWPLLRAHTWSLYRETTMALHPVSMYFQYWLVFQKKRFLLLEFYYFLSCSIVITSTNETIENCPLSACSCLRTLTGHPLVRILRLWYSGSGCFKGTIYLLNLSLLKFS